MKHKYWEKPNYYEERDKYFADWDRRRNEAYLAAQHKLCVCLKAEQLHEIKAIYEKNIEINQKSAESEKREQEKLAEIKRKEEEKQALIDQKQREFEEMLKPRAIPEHIRFEHTHILGPSGSGKTSLIQQLILEDVRTLDPTPAYVVIDPKGLMVERISWLNIKQKIIFIDPTSPPLPALDLFHQPELALNEHQRNRIRNQLIETFAYIFSTANARLTQRQSVPFAYVVRLVFSMGGNIDTLMDILEDDQKTRRFYPHMLKLGEQDRGARRFFENDFYSTGFNETRQQIKTRLYEILSKPELMTMFAAGQNKLSIFDCLQERKMVLINTAMPQLGSKASQLLGRYFIAATLNAAFARAAIPKSQWTPAFLIIDEFQDFADEEKTPELLRLAREYNLGVILAHQNMFCAELNDDIRNAISTNTSIKYAASPEGGDLNYMARDMRCDPDFLKTQIKSGNIAKFACYVRGMNLTHPFSYNVELGYIDRWPKLPNDEYVRIKQIQRDWYKPDPKPTKAPPSLHSQDECKQTPPEPTKPRREPHTQTQPPTKSTPTDPHTGDHTEPAANWGDQ